MLTNTFVKNVKAADKPKKYADGGGLYLYVTTKGGKFWRMAYRFCGKAKSLSFGEYPIVSLREARDRRDEAKKLLANDIDPSQQKKERKSHLIAESRNTFELIAREWQETQTIHNTPAHRHRMLFNLEHYIFPYIGKKHIADVIPQDILNIARKYEEKSTWISHRIVQICGRVFRYAVITGRAKYNVTSELHGILRPIPGTHRPGLTNPSEAGQFLLDIDSYTGTLQTRSALQLMVLTFVRTQELRCAEWREFDFQDRLWRIPAERMKMRTPHYVPLSDQSIKVLKELQCLTGDSKFLFPNVRDDNRPLSKSTLLQAIRFMGYRRDRTCVHGFRTMASTLLNEMGYNRDWIERQLAHQERDGVRDAYNCAQYLPQRRKMMQEYADYLDTLKENARTLSN